MKNIAPPKLKGTLLMGGLTIPELAVAGVLMLMGFFSGSMAYALLFPGAWFAFCARLYQGKSIRKMLAIGFQYHSTPQQFTRRIRTHEKTCRNGKPHPIQAA